MVVPSFLFSDWRDESSGGAIGSASYYETGKTKTALGNTITGSVQVDTATGWGQWAGSKAIRFQGEYYCAFGRTTNAKIYKKNDPDTASGGSPDDDWSVAYTPTATAVVALNAEILSGMVQVVVNGTPTLICVLLYQAGSLGGVTRFRVIHFDGSTWSEPGGTLEGNNNSAGNGNPAAVDLIAFENRVFWWNWNGSGVTMSDVRAYDPSTNTIANIVVENTGSGDPTQSLHGKFFTFNSKLYVVVRNQATNDFGIWEYDGGTNFLHVVTLVADCIVSTDNDWHKIAAWTKGGNAYVGCLSDESGRRGFRVYEIPASGASLGTPTDITTTVVPVAWRADNEGGAFPNGDERWGWYALHDPEEDKVYVYGGNLQSGLSTWALYEFTDGTTLMTAVGTGGGGVTNEAPPYIFHGGYAYIHKPGDLECWITDISEAVGGGVTISFKARGDSGNADKFVRFKVENDGEPSDTNASLFGTASGGSATRNGNAVEQVDADGSTTYTVKWNPSLNGFSSGDFAQVTPKITTS